MQDAAAKLVRVKGGNWCPQCAGKGPVTITDMRPLAAETAAGAFQTSTSTITPIFSGAALRGKAHVPPVRFSGDAYVRAVSSKQKLRGFPEKERRHWQILSDSYLPTGNSSQSVPIHIVKLE